MEIYQMSAEILPSIHFVDDTVIEPPYIHKRRRAGEYIMYVIKHGEMYLLENEEPLSLRAGDICILDKDRVHVGVKASVCGYYYIHFQHRDMRLMAHEDEEEALDILMKQRMEALESDIFSYAGCEDGKIYLPKLWHVEDAAAWVKLEELLEQAKQENYSPMENYKIMCACNIQQVFMEIGRSFLTAEQKNDLSSLPGYYYTVHRILAWLNQEFATRITGELLEQKFESNFDYMNRVFKKVTGQTIFQYLTRIRINHAKILILHTSMKMSEVGKKVGFPDEYYFNRVFKKQVGVPPAAYAKIHQKVAIG